jgi:hypothetical protein
MIRKLFILASCVLIGISGYAQDAGIVRRSLGATPNGVNF